MNLCVVCRVIHFALIVSQHGVREKTVVPCVKSASHLSINLLWYMIFTSFARLNIVISLFFKKNKSKTKKRKVRVKAKSQGEDHAIRGHPIFFGLTRHYNQYEDDDIGHFHFNIANLLFFQFTRGLDMDEIEYSPRSRSSHSSDYMNPYNSRLVTPLVVKCLGPNRVI